MEAVKTATEDAKAVIVLVGLALLLVVPAAILAIGAIPVVAMALGLLSLVAFPIIELAKWSWDAPERLFFPSLVLSWLFLVVRMFRSH